MKICVIAPTVIPILGRNQQYGGIELVVALATEELVKRGHEVYLFATGDSETSAKLIPLSKSAVGQGISFEMEKELNRKAYEIAVAERPDIIWDHTLALHAQEMRENKSKFLFQADIVIDPKQLVDTKDIPVLETLHGPAKDHIPALINHLSNKDYYFISISHDQADRFSKFIKKEQHLGTVYNAVDTDFYEVSDGKKQNYFAWVGRYGMEKGAHIAIEVAHRLDMPIKILGKLVEKHEIEYFNKFIKPKLGPRDEVLGIVKSDKKAKLYKNATAVLMTNLWPEPFGLVAVEAMASGTPVIGPSIGSLTEVIGDSGVLIPVDDLNLNENDLEITKSQEKYIDRIVKRAFEAKKIPPNIPRSRVEKLFCVRHNVDGYEEAFAKAMYLKSKKIEALLEE